MRVYHTSLILLNFIKKSDKYFTVDTEELSNTNKHVDLMIDNYYASVSHDRTIKIADEILQVASWKYEGILLRNGITHLAMKQPAAVSRNLRSL